MRPVGEAISVKEIVLYLKDWLSYFISNWLYVISFVVIGACGGCLYSFIRTPVYVAEMTFALEEEKSNGLLGGYAGIASQFGIDIGGGGGGAFAGDNLLELLKSRLIVEKALLSTVSVGRKQISLADYYIDCNSYRDQWKDSNLNGIKFPIDAAKSDLSLTHDSLISIFFKQLTKRNLSVTKVDKKLSIISVKVEHADEMFAKFFTEALVEQVSEFYVSTKTKKAAENLAILQHQTDSVRGQLNAAISGVAASIDVNPNPNPARQVLRVSSQRRQVDVQANSTILGELVKNLEIAKVSLRRETPLIQIIDAPVLPLESKVVSTLFAAILGAAIFLLLALLSLSLKRVVNYAQQP